MKTIVLIIVLAAALIGCSGPKRCYRGSDCATFCRTIDDSVKYDRRSI